MDINLIKSQMNEEVLFWSRFNYAVSSFCFEQTSSSFKPEKIVCSLVGEELEWCGSQAFLFLANRVLETQKNTKELESRCRAAENLLESEASSSNNLRKQIKSLQRSNEDSEWSLHEQIAHLNIIYGTEKESNLDLTEKLTECTNQLNELEIFISTNKSHETLHLEQEIREQKQRILELQAEKDDCLMKMKRDKKRSLIPIVSSPRVGKSVVSPNSPTPSNHSSSFNLKNSSVKGGGADELTGKVNTSDSINSSTSYYSVVSDENSI